MLTKHTNNHNLLWLAATYLAKLLLINIHEIILLHFSDHSYVPDYVCIFIHACECVLEYKVCVILYLLCYFPGR